MSERGLIAVGVQTASSAAWTMGRLMNIWFMVDIYGRYSISIDHEVCTL